MSEDNLYNATRCLFILKPQNNITISLALEPGKKSTKEPGCREIFLPETLN